MISTASFEALGKNLAGGMSVASAIVALFISSASGATTSSKAGLLGSDPFPAIGHCYRVDFAEVQGNGKFVVELNFQSATQMTYRGVRPDGTYGTPETVATKVTPVRDKIFLVTWIEKDFTAVVHVEDYKKNVIYTNIANPDHTMDEYKGPMRQISCKHW